MTVVSSISSSTSIGSTAASASTTSTASTAITQPRATHFVDVGTGEGFAYNPSQLNVSIWDTVCFNFLRKNHSVTQSDLASPCTYNEGFDTGLNQINPLNISGRFLGDFQVNVSKPLWLYWSVSVEATLGRQYRQGGDYVRSSFYETNKDDEIKRLVATHLYGLGDTNISQQRTELDASAGPINISVSTYRVNRRERLHLLKSLVTLQIEELQQHINTIKSRYHYRPSQGQAEALTEAESYVKLAQVAMDKL